MVIDRSGKVMKEVKNKKNLDIMMILLLIYVRISHIMHCLYEGKGSQKRFLCFK